LVRRHGKRRGIFVGLKGTDQALSKKRLYSHRYRRECAGLRPKGSIISREVIPKREVGARKRGEEKSYRPRTLDELWENKVTTPSGGMKGRERESRFFPRYKEEEKNTRRIQKYSVINLE